MVVEVRVKTGKIFFTFRSMQRGKMEGFKKLNEPLLVSDESLKFYGRLLVEGK